MLFHVLLELTTLAYSKEVKSNVFFLFQMVNNNFFINIELDEFLITALKMCAF